MALWSGTPGRLAAVFFCVIMMVSTGVAGSTVLEDKGVTGHTTFVEAVGVQPPGIQGPEKPIQYGLATLRVDYFFGLVSKQRPLDESRDWMVFVWSEGTPDPRDDPSLRPTGDLAHVTDRHGVRWVVYEFGYDADRGAGSQPSADPAFYAYAVAVGPKRSLGDGTTYNHVLTYRPDRLVAPLLEAEEENPPYGAAAVAPAASAAETDPETWVSQGVLEDRPRVQEFALKKGVAPVPPGLHSVWPDA